MPEFIFEYGCLSTEVKSRVASDWPLQLLPFYLLLCITRFSAMEQRGHLLTKGANGEVGKERSVYGTTIQDVSLHPPRCSKFLSKQLLTHIHQHHDCI